VNDVRPDDGVSPSHFYDADPRGEIYR